MKKRTGLKWGGYGKYTLRLALRRPKNLPAMSALAFPANLAARCRPRVPHPEMTTAALTAGQADRFFRLLFWGCVRAGFAHRLPSIAALCCSAKLTRRRGPPLFPCVGNVTPSMDAAAKHPTRQSHQ